MFMYRFQANDYLLLSSLMRLKRLRGVLIQRERLMSYTHYRMALLYLRSRLVDVDTVD
jgi:hypothetical protein